MLGPRNVNPIFTDRKARRARATALFRIEGLAQVEGCRRRSRRMAIVAVRDDHESGVTEVGE